MGNTATLEIKSKKIQIKLERERLRELVELDDIIALQQNDLSALKRVFGLFIWDPDLGRYLDEEEGSKLAGKLSLGQVEEFGGTLQSMMEAVAVPTKKSRD